MKLNSIKLKDHSFLQRPFFRFIAIGGGCALLNIVFLFFLTSLLKLPYMLSIILLHISVNSIGFFLNKRYTYKSNKKVYLKEFYKYQIVMISSFIWVAVLMYILVDTLNLWYLYAFVIVTSIMTIYNFLVHSYWTFRPELPNTHELSVSKYTHNFQHKYNSTSTYYHKNNIINSTLKLFMKQLPNILIALGVIIFMLISLCICRAGFQGYIDDINYIEAARGWRDHFPFLGINHWHNRYPLVLPIAVFFAIFGESDFSVALPSTLAYIAIVYSTYLLLLYTADKATAAIGACFASTLPLLAFYGGVDYPDIIEGGLVIAGLTVFFKAIFDTHIKSHNPLFWAGILFGLAFGTRQFPVTAIFFLGILYVFSFGIPRRHYWFIAAGFASVILAEIVYYWFVSGDPLYRYYLDLHPKNINYEDVTAHIWDKIAAKHAFTEESPILNFNRISQWKNNGLAHLHWTIDPYLDFLTDANYGFLFWLAIPCSFWVCLAKQSPKPAKTVARLLVLFSGLWFFVVVYLLASRPQARYFIPIVFSAVIITALWLRYAVWPKNRPTVVIIIAGLVVANWLLLDLKPIPQYVAHQLQGIASSTGELIYASPEIIKKSDFSLRQHELYKRVAATPAPKGGLVFISLKQGDTINERNVIKRIKPARQPLVYTLLDTLKVPMPDTVRRLFKRPYPDIVLVRQE
jgi:putative flippase GtrA